MKPTETSGSTSPTEGKNQKQEELQPYSLRNGDFRHSKLDKMKRKIIMQEMKDKGKNPQDQRNKEGIGKLPERVFRVTTVKMILNLKKRMEAQVEKIQTGLTRT